MEMLWILGLGLLAVTSNCYVNAKLLKPSRSDMFWGLDKPQKSYKLPKLPFGYHSLSRHIDRTTLKIQHSEIFKEHTKNLNSLLKKWRYSKNPKHKSSKTLAKKSIIDIWRKVREIPAEFRKEFMYYGGSYINHLIYFATMTPNRRNKDRVPSKSFGKILKTSFYNMTELKKKFEKQANGLLGNGWVYLVRATGYKSGEYLTIMTTLAEMTPMDNKRIFPILALDVREHAYFKKYGNDKSKYIQAWWKLIDWNKVEKLLHWWQMLVPAKKLKGNKS